jgi:L-fuconolactonase
LTGLNITGKSADPEWTKSVQRVAAFDNVYCKVSGIFQRSGKMTAPKDLTYYEPTIEVVYAAFGEDRIIYGSNWPVSDRGGSYGEQLAIIRSYFESKGERVLQNIFVTNAQKFYGLD